MREEKALVEYGYCHCGCGKLTNLSRQNHIKYGWIKGKPMSFVFGHANRKGRPVLQDGYKIERNTNSPRSCKNGYAKSHILIAEKIIGKELPKKSVIHHPFGEKQNNKILVICENQGYHLLLHLREKAYTACGNASWRRCWVCKKYDTPANLYIRGSHSHHTSCHSNYYKKKREGANV